MKENWVDSVLQKAPWSLLICGCRKLDKICCLSKLMTNSHKCLWPIMRAGFSTLCKKKKPLDLSFPYATKSGLFKIVTLNKHFGVGNIFCWDRIRSN